jgi:hypothetical protein
VVAEENQEKETQSRRKAVKTITEEALNAESLRMSCLEDIVRTTRHVLFDFLTDLHGAYNVIRLKLTENWCADLFMLRFGH